MSQKPTLPKGTRDFLPEVMLRREFIFDTIRRVFKKYGYVPIETPSMEQLDVLTGKYGEEGDRLIFKILNSGDFLKKASSFDDAKKLLFEISEKALRYDLTVPFARVVVMHQNDLTFPFKRYQIQPVWRADRPQKGRYREFYQCDADAVGSDSLLFEAEFIAIFDEALSRLGLDDFSVMVNNRKILTGYAEVVGQLDKFQSICMAIDKLDKIGVEGVKTEMEKRGIPANSAERIFELISYEGDIMEKLDFLEAAFADSEVGQKGVAELKEVFSIYPLLDGFNGKVELNLQLARGLEYYTGTIFEVKVNNVEMGSLAGGGRYDDLTGVFGKPGLSGVGISFGADRIYDVMNELQLFDQITTSNVQVMLVNFGEETFSTNLDVLAKLRKQDIQAELYPDNAKLKKQFSYADKNQIPYTLLIGEEEMISGKYQIKHMQSGEQQTLSVEEIISLLSKDASRDTQQI